MALSEGKVGPVLLSDGSGSAQRMTRTGALATTQTHGDYTEGVSRQSVFSMQLAAITTGTAAGNIVGAAAAAATQFALFNPVSSGYNLALLRFNFVTNSGTPAAGQIMHGIYVGGVPTLAANGTIRNNYINGRSSVANGYALAAGAALTGGTVAPVPLMAANIGQTATVAGSQQNATLDRLDGMIVIPPGTGWAPLLPGAGTTWLWSAAITWEEIPV